MSVIERFHGTHRRGDVPPDQCFIREPEPTNANQLAVAKQAPAECRTRDSRAIGIQPSDSPSA